MPLHDDRGFDREILDIIPERFDSDPDSHHARRGAHTRLILAVALALLAIAALGVAARHIFFGEGPKVQAEGAVPLLKPDDKPIKTKPGPDERGGMDVPNRDKLVYERMGSSDAEPQSERLLPPPEQPQTPPPNQPRAPSIKPAFPMPPAREVVPTPPSPPKTAMTEPPPPPPPPPAQSVTAPLPPASAKPAAAAKTPAPAPVVASAKPAAAPPVPPKASAGGAWVVQLGALKTEAEARTEWGIIHTANKEILGHLSPDIIRVDLGAKGVYWRVRGGPLDEAQARTICALLKKRNQDCILAKK